MYYYAGRVHSGNREAPGDSPSVPFFVSNVNTAVAAASLQRHAQANARIGCARPRRVLCAGVPTRPAYFSSHFARPIDRRACLSLLLFPAVIYYICEDWSLDFVSMYACTGLWNSFFLFIYAFTDASNLMKWCTRYVTAFPCSFCLNNCSRWCTRSVRTRLTAVIFVQCFDKPIVCWMMDGTGL